MNTRTHNILLAVLTIAIAATSILADPLPGRDTLKFDQQPMITTFVDGAVYFGHDEESTLYLVPGANGYTGMAMADDFADEFDTPVVHIKWWGSYLGNQFNTPVSKFLIAFESDEPVSPINNFSHPKDVLSSQVVTVGPLGVQSGTFTETLLFANPIGVGDDVYEYNAELKIPFAQKPDTVYWLKIAALIDDPADMVRWGWHNRDYTLMNPLASVFPAVAPGEHVEGTTFGGTEVWHFQDDAVSADTAYFMSPDGTWDLIQDNYIPQHYIDGVDGPMGNPLVGPDIGRFSKDLAFQLYTVPIPEPATMVLLSLGSVLTVLRRRRRSA